ncbi:hypothetical protein AYL99_00409 [Fonsecaea erecta]|uniref:Uncharacterized protein n=1 Tax=Fonsecaea erecta TaxID=1367422 RepID=A0A178ZXL5_9EURO|nr:hypothetical protein AYL99_00409 [Fonsecaea erecta]OAP64437.1 hypothetical protein AYL99_00409 [Fonsecaea erecta]
MPNKKSKPNASKGKSPAHPSAAAKAAASAPAPAVEETTPYVPLTLPRPSITDDFWTKNARAKALILSTLVPGSEAWKIAEPIEIASDIWRALEDYFTPMRLKARAKQPKQAKQANSADAGSAGGGPAGSEVATAFGAGAALTAATVSATGHVPRAASDTTISKSEAKTANGKPSSFNNSSSGSVAGKSVEKADKKMDTPKDRPPTPPRTEATSSGPSDRVPLKAEDNHTRSISQGPDDVPDDVVRSIQQQQMFVDQLRAHLKVAIDGGNPPGSGIDSTLAASNEALVQLDMQLQLYKSRPELAQAKAKAQGQGAPPNLGQSQAKAEAGAQAPVEARSPVEDQPQRKAEAPAEAQVPAQPAISQPSTPAVPRLSTLTPSGRWKAHPVKHDSYLSEENALAFAQGFQDRKKQIQAAATKVLMQKLPTRDMRLLWAVLYGGEDAPWPGSCSAIIPGVTTMQWQNKSYELDLNTLGWTWNSKGDNEKG